METCKRIADITVPLEEVEAETDKAVLEFQKQAKMPGFRPGKVPLSVIRKRFEKEIRQQVVEQIVPRAFRRTAEANNWQIVGDPVIKDVHFHEGKELHFSTAYEVAPEIDLGEYRGLEVAYVEPQVNDEDVAKGLDQLRERKAEYVNLDPRPLEKGDHAAVALLSTSGIDGEPITSDETVFHIGAADTLAEFTEALAGAAPGDVRQVEVDYPENYGNRRLAGRKVSFDVTVKAVRRKELPEANDEFAKDLGDYQSLEELQAEIRRNLLRERELENQNKAKAALVDTLVAAHQFPVPDAWVDAQIKGALESQFQELAAAGVDPNKLDLDWERLREAMAVQATRDVKATMLLGRIAERESIEVMHDEIDREVQRAARQTREPVAAVRKRLNEQGAVPRIANQIRTNKVLNFLFENAKKVASSD